MRRHLKKPFTPALEQAISLMRKRQSLTPCLEQAIFFDEEAEHLERELQHLVSQKAPIYRGVATSVSDLQRCQRWW